MISSLSQLSQVFSVRDPVATDSGRIVLLKGAEIEPYLPEIAELYLAVWREPPYQYDGTIKDYLPWLQTYSNAKNSIACLLFDEKKLIGAVTGAPLNEMPEKWRGPLKGLSGPIFYLGEEVLLKQARSHHFGSQLFNRFVQAIPNSFQTLAFVRIEESIAPPLNAVLKQRGCTEHEDKIVEVNWHDAISHQEIPHKLIYWTLDLPIHK